MDKVDLKNGCSYQIIPGEGYVTLKLSGELVSFPVNLQNEFKEVLVDPIPNVLVNCSAVSALGIDWVRFLVRLRQDLKKHNKGIVLLGAQTNLMDQLKREGVDSAFKFFTVMHDALASWGLATKKKLDTDFINPFLEATIKVLKIQASIEVIPGKIYLKTANEKFTGDVSGIIGIVSEAFNGSVVISFPEATFIAIMSQMLGENYTVMTPEILDGAGEITNMVFGQAKIVLNSKGYGIKTALPSVVSGKDHSLTALTTGPSVVVPFTSTAGNFFVEICISN